MRFIKLSVLTIFITGALQSCASADLNRRLDERVTQETDVYTQKDLDAKTSSLMKGTPGLSEAQRARMAALKAKIQGRLRELNSESRKLRELLIQDLLSPQDKSGEILSIRDSLRLNSKARIDAIFSAVDKANDVLGRTKLLQEAMDLQMVEDESNF